MHRTFSNPGISGHRPKSRTNSTLALANVLFSTIVALLLAAHNARAQALPPLLHNPTPFIDEISPTAAKVGGADFILTVKGGGFTPSAVVKWQLDHIAIPLQTMFISSAELTARVPFLLIARAATATVTVQNPDLPPEVGTSNPWLLPVTVPTASVALSFHNIGVGAGPNAIVAADFNGDGKLDLATANYLGNNVSILLGKGDGGFTLLPISPATGYLPSSIAVGDFNGDHKPDLAVVNYCATPTSCGTGGSVTILLGKGDGTFTAAPVVLAVGINPDSVAIGDFNRDGKLDLAVSNFGNSDVSILLGNGDGTFTAGVSPSVGPQPAALALGDFNGDGKLDLVVLTQAGYSSAVFILLGNGDGTFAPASSPALEGLPFSVSVGDFNGDGKLDLAIGSTSGFPVGEVYVLLGNGDGTFSPGPTSSVSSGYPSSSMTVGDFNGDGKLDLAYEVAYPSNSYTILLGNGDGTFNESGSIEVSNNGNGPAALGDFNQDGRLDLASVNQVNGGTVSVILQQLASGSQP